MKLVITGMGVLTAAGRGVEPLFDLLRSGGNAFSPVPPYPADGLSRPLCAAAAGLERDRPAEALLAVATADALAQAGLEAVPSGSGLVVGTSSGNISGPWERWHRALLEGRELPEEGCGRDAPTRALASQLGIRGP